MRTLNLICFVQKNRKNVHGDSKLGLTHIKELNGCKEKIRNFRNNIKNMKIDNQNETILVKIIEDICDKLDKTIFSSFKKVAVNEFDRFLKISTVESKRF